MAVGVVAAGHDVVVHPTDGLVRAFRVGRLGRQLVVVVAHVDLVRLELLQVGLQEVRDGDVVRAEGVVGALLEPVLVDREDDDVLAAEGDAGLGQDGVVVPVLDVVVPGVLGLDGVPIVIAAAVVIVIVVVVLLRVVIFAVVGLLIVPTFTALAFVIGIVVVVIAIIVSSLLLGRCICVLGTDRYPAERSPKIDQGGKGPSSGWISALLLE